MWRIPRIWEGGDVWVIGGGTSVPYQFDIPMNVIHRVIERRATPDVFIPYMHYLADKHVIGVNMAFQLGSVLDMVVFGDSKFFADHKVSISQFKGIRVSCHVITKGIPWVKTVQRDGTKPHGVSTKPNAICWNGSTGGAAIDLAVHLGAKRILLLGFDMNIDPKTNMQHWHDLYYRGPVNTGRRIRNLPFHRHLQAFPVIAADAARLGVEIINLSPDSAIEAFPKMSLQAYMSNGHGL